MESVSEVSGIAIGTAHRAERWGRVLSAVAMALTGAVLSPPTSEDGQTFHSCPFCTWAVSEHV